MAPQRLHNLPGPNSLGYDESVIFVSWIFLGLMLPEERIEFVWNLGTPCIHMQFSRSVFLLRTESSRLLSSASSGHSEQNASF